MNTAPPTEPSPTTPDAFHWQGPIRPEPPLRAAMARALEADPSLDAVAPIDVLSLAGTATSATGVDPVAAAWTWGSRTPIIVTATEGGILWRHAEGGTKASPRIGLLPWLAAPGGSTPPTDPAIPAALGASEAHRSATRAGLDGRPVVLHVLRDGDEEAQLGASREACKHADHHHLVLAIGDPRTPDRAPTWSLRHAGGAPPLRGGRLPSGITSGRTVLDEVIADFRVGALRIASFEGYGLALLRTGLPTTIVHRDPPPTPPDATAAAIPPSSAPTAREPEGGAATRWLGDRWVAVRFHLLQAASLWSRGVRSLRQRGVAATFNAVRRRLGPRPLHRIPPAPTHGDASPAFEPCLGTVRASIVIPVYGKLPYTLACLQALSDGPLPPGTEVIVVDDASPDASGEALASIPGLRYHRNPENLGFVGSCNAGAALARGEYVVFLNNDTTPAPGWLASLLATFDVHPDTGLAGAMLVYPDGRLQESGGIVFADGSAWNYGRFEAPTHPAFTHVREVDYCSGAAIALPRALFEGLGGFDPRYAPAYYEDTDLAMKVRNVGLKVRVQPASIVVHHEGITAGTDTASGVKAYQVRNRGRFLERWSSVLRAHPPAGTDPDIAARHRADTRVLVVDVSTPMPDRDSGSLRLFELLRLMVDERCAVTFVPSGTDEGEAYMASMRQLGIETWPPSRRGAFPEWLARHGRRFDLVIVSRHHVLTPLLPLLRRHAPQARIVFDTVDLHHLREAREAERLGDASLRRAAARTRDTELSLVRAVDRTWVVSPVEQALLATAVPGAIVDIVSNIHRPRGRGPERGARRDLLFVGGFRHPPNTDAARWLADEIMPRLHAARPDIGLSLVGSDAPADIVALGERHGITVHGHVPDLEPMLDGHRVSVAPLRYGAGVKGKVNQALAHGLPVVATRCAIEGMGLEDGRDVLVADDTDAFVAAVLRLYEDDALWRRLADGGLANTEREFSPDRARRALRAVLDSLR